MKRIIFFFPVIFLFACGGEQTAVQQATDAAVSPVVTGAPTAEIIVQEILDSTVNSEGIKMVAQKIVGLLKAKDAKALSGYIHPVQGVRFSPSAYVENTHRLFKPDEFEEAWDSDKKLVWGGYDGSGEPIALTFQAYYKKFIFDKDYSLADSITVNSAARSGNTKNNANEFYPGAHTVDFYFKGTEKNGFMDWSTLRLVIRQKKNDFKLVGVVHDAWSI